MKLYLLFPVLITLLSAEPLTVGSGVFSLVPDTTEVYKTAPVKDGEVELQIHGFLPADHKPSDSRPAALFFHGGGWYGGTPDQFSTHSVGT